jgi:hypothetical protein
MTFGLSRAVLLVTVERAITTNDDDGASPTADQGRNPTRDAIHRPSHRRATSSDATAPVQ